MIIEENEEDRLADEEAEAKRINIELHHQKILEKITEKLMSKKIS